MNIGIFGTGMVGQTIGTALVGRGQSVVMGSRSSDNAKGLEWAEQTGNGARLATFADAAAHGEVLINCTAGVGSIDALRAAGEENLRNKILIDISNPLDFSQGFPPTLSVCNTDSLGEQIQREFPDVQVVKTLNTLNCFLMVEPTLVPGNHTLFMSGDDESAKERASELLYEWFGWSPERIIDLGDITTARGTEMVLPLWVRLMAALGTPMFNFSIAQQAGGSMKYEV